MNIILSLGFLEAIILALLVFFKKNKCYPDNWLSLFFMVFGINIILAYLEIYNQENNYRYPNLIMLTPSLLLLHGPIIWIYVRSLVKNNKTSWGDLVHFIPFIVFVINLSIMFWFVPNEKKIHDYTSENFKNRFTYNFFVLLIAVSIPMYLINSIWLLKKHQQRIKLLFSNIQRINLRWLSLLLMSALLIYGLLGLFNSVSLVKPIISYKTFQFTGFIIASLFIGVFGYMGLNQTSLFSSLKLIEHQPEKTSKELLKHEDIATKIQVYMQNEKPFLIPQLTIDEFAKGISIEPQIISNYLNNKIGINFYEFINQFRVEEFKKRIASRSDNKLTLIAIAFECGFNSKASFNRIFKTFENMTPSDFVLKSQKN